MGVSLGHMPPEALDYVLYERSLGNGNKRVVALSTIVSTRDDIPQTTTSPGAMYDLQGNVVWEKGYDTPSWHTLPSSMALTPDLKVVVAREDTVIDAYGMYPPPHLPGGHP